MIRFHAFTMASAQGQVAEILARRRRLVSHQAGQRVVAEPLVVGLRAFLVRVGGHHGGIQPDADHPSSILSAIRTPGIQPWRASTPAHARRRPAFTAALTRP